MKPLPQIEGGFSVIYADPPWSYSNTSTRASAADNYEMLTFEQLSLLPVNKIRADDCVLFLWTTCPFIPLAVQLGTGWGFDYKTVAFTWAKRNKVSNSPFFGMGNWTRANSELCLLFTRGKPKRVSAAVPQFIWSPVLRHSEKPAAVRDRIVKLMGDVPRLEMFSRHSVPGWHRWGNNLLP